MTGQHIASCGAVSAILLWVLLLGIEGAGTLPARAGEPGQGTTTGPAKAAAEDRDLEEEKERKERIRVLMKELMTLQKYIDSIRSKVRHPDSDPAIVIAERTADKLEDEILRESGAKGVPARQERPRLPNSAVRPWKRDTRLPQPKQARLTPYTNPKELKPGQKFNYSIKVSLDDGWQILPLSPEQPPDEKFVWTEFDFFETGGFEVVSDWHASEAPSVKPHPVRQTIEFFEKEVTWSIRLKVPQGMEAGEKVLKCQAGYQIMNDRAISDPGRWTLQDVRVKVRR
jgi:hypothetical protein